MAVDTSGLTGYALSYANALNSGKSAADAAQIAGQGSNTDSGSTAQQLNNALNGNGSDSTGSTGSIPWNNTTDYSGLKINGQSADGTDTTKVGNQSMTTPIYQGRTIAPIRQVAESAGAHVTWDPQTGNVIVNGHTISPTTIDQGTAFAPLREISQAIGLPYNAVQWDPNSRTATLNAVQQQEQPYSPSNSANSQSGGIPSLTPYQAPNMPQMPDYLNPLLAQMPQAPQLQPYQAPDVSGWYNQLQPMSQFNPDWNNYYQQAHNQFDPTTQAQLQQLNTKMNSDIVASDAKMNQRGLWNSGIAQSVEDDIRAKTSDSIAKVFMTAQSNIAKVAQQLYTDAYNQWYKGNDLALRNNQMILSQVMNQQKQSFQQWLSTQQLNMQQYQYAINAWDHMSQLVQKDAITQVDTQMKYQQMVQTGQNDYQNRLAQLQRALIPYTMGPTPAQQLPYQYQTANNQADNQLKYAQMMGFDQNGKPTLDTFKALGYVQMPDGSLRPTEQSSNNQQNYALNLAKALGYVTNPDGSITPTEQARHDQATITLDQQKLLAQVQQWAASNRLKADSNANTAQSIANKAQYDTQMLKHFADQTADSRVKEQLTYISDQMRNVANMINNETDPTRKQALLDQYNGLKDQAAAATGSDAATAEANQNLGK